MLHSLGVAFDVVWLATIVASIPAAFVAGYLALRGRFESHWQRLFAGTALGFAFVPFTFFAAYLLPFTLPVVAVAALVSWFVLVRRRRARLRAAAVTACQ